MALIDTGGSHTCISANVIKDLGLSPRGKQPAYGVHGAGSTNSYQFQVGFMFPPAQGLTGRKGKRYRHVMQWHGIYRATRRRF